MDRPKLYSLLSPLFHPLSVPYSGMMRIRRRRYQSGGAPVYRASVPCVSVGNIAWGGTGKTPLVDWLLTWARSRGLRAIVLTRGYKADPGKEPLLVTRETAPEVAGDEPLLLARTHPEAAILVHPQRARSAAWAEKHIPADLFLMDDGMQHLSMARQSDIVLLRPMDLAAEWNRVIPSGSWREGRSALSTASCFVIKAGQEEIHSLSPLIAERLSSFEKPVFSFQLLPVGLRNVFQDSSPINLPDQQEPGPGEGIPPLGKYLLFSGVGFPQGVAETAAELTGHSPCRHIIFPDHHHYGPEDVRSLVKAAGEADLPLICTAKDAVKIRRFQKNFGDLHVLELQATVGFGPSFFTGLSFPEWWEDQWKAIQNCCNA